MPGRYRTLEGVVVGRKALPSGAVVLRLLTPEGPVRALAKGADRPSARSGRLSLFYRVRFQLYQREQSEGLATLTQVTLEEPLRITRPEAFAAAGLLAELGWHLLSPEIAPQGFALFASALRGLARGADWRAVLVWAGFRLLKLAGHAPTGRGSYLDPEGALLSTPKEGAVYLGEEGARALAAVLHRPGKEALRTLEEAPLDRLLAGFLRYAEQQAGPLKSAPLLRRLT